MSGSDQRPQPPRLRDVLQAEPAGETRQTWVTILVRYVLPAAVVLGGVIVMTLGSEADLEGGAGIVSAGLGVYFLNWLFRAGASGDREREAEDRARDYFDEHGRWPS